MTNKTARNVAKLAAAIAMTAAFAGTPCLAGQFTVQQGKKYRATLSLKSIERLADNATIAAKFRALGFSGVHVSGAGGTRKVTGVWQGKSTSAPIPSQIVAVAQLQ